MSDRARSAFDARYAKLGALRRPLMPSRSSIRRPLEDKITNVAACAWIAGLIAWYAGGSAAIDRTLDGMTLFVPVAVLSLIGGVVALVMEPKLSTSAFGTAVFLALGLMLFGLDAAALLNRFADGSTGRQERATVLSFEQPSKGPRTVTLALGGEKISFDASHAEGCDVGAFASVELRDGALGAPWLHSIRCEH
jgi:hypothetical protein